MPKVQNQTVEREKVSGIKNRTVFIADNLEIMRGMEDESVDLIYLDPPFNSKHNYAAPIGSKAAGVEFKDTWTLNDIDQAWWGEIADQNESLYAIIGTAGKIGGKSAMSYLIYMAIRILEMQRILKSTGSLYLHCDTTMSHYLKLVLDSIFGAKSFRNDITWKRTSSHNDGKRYGKISDQILFYSKSDKYTWNEVYLPYSEEYVKKNFRNKDHRGHYSHEKLTAENLSAGGYEYEYKGHARIWERPLESMLELEKNDMLHYTKKKGGLPRRKIYLKDAKGLPLQNIWTDISSVKGAERLGYPTQKPLALLERIIDASSYAGDVVFDPFCGCATACLAAERKGRKWIGCDISERAYSLIEQRLKNDAGIAKFITGAGEVVCRTDIPQRKGRRSKGIKHVLYGEQHGYCNGCKYHYQFKDLEVDHVIPKAKGGQDDDKNLQLLCGNCNRRKGKKLTMTELRAVLKADGMKFGKGRTEP